MTKGKAGGLFKTTLAVAAVALTVSSGPAHSAERSKRDKMLYYVVYCGAATQFHAKILGKMGRNSEAKAARQAYWFFARLSKEYLNATKADMPLIAEAQDDWTGVRKTDTDERRLVAERCVKDAWSLAEKIDGLIKEDDDE